MFHTFQKAIVAQFESMKSKPLFRTDTSKEAMWETYLSSFPEGTNPLYKTRTEHDCNCCKSFIRAVGNIVAIDNGELISIWDVKLDNFYGIVAKAMSVLVKSSRIDNMFLHTEPSAGVKQNRQQMEDGTIVAWDHFYLQLPRELVVGKDYIGTRLGQARSTKDVFLRSLLQIDQDAIETVLELIGQNSLYRGEEHKFVLNTFLCLQKEFEKSDTDLEEDIFCWSRLTLPSSITHIRNTVIGSLLIDLTEGKDLEYAVKSFEQKVAPANYKRPTALITKAMLERAQQTIKDLGYMSALERRYATLNDITINNILFADREVKAKLEGDIFDTLAESVPDKSKNLDKVEEVNIETFINNILPKAESIELLVENKHSNNLVSLIAPVDPEAKNMFKWYNNFSWSYTGEMTDSVKERVKAAGGKVEGDLRCSLSWFNYDDLDLHMHEPGGYEIYFGNRGQKSPNGGNLDVDMNAGSGQTRNAVENIIYLNKDTMKEGIYKVVVENFSKRESVDVGFEMEIEFDGIVHTLAYDKAVGSKHEVVVAEIKYSKKDGFSIVKSIPSSKTVKNIWGIPTQSFRKVSTVMLSPNYWDDKAVGNKHWFFMLDGCANDGKARGFFNEFLGEELSTHRKVLEVVGSKMKTDMSKEQLSGLGFSSTQRNDILCRVKGGFNRVVKLTF